MAGEYGAGVPSLHRNGPQQGQPGARSAGGIGHPGHFASKVVDVLCALHLLTGRGEYVFPSGRGKGWPMSENTINAVHLGSLRVGANMIPLRKTG